MARLEERREGRDSRLRSNNTGVDEIAAHVDGRLDGLSWQLGALSAKLDSTKLTAVSPTGVSFEEKPDHGAFAPGRSLSNKPQRPASQPGDPSVGSMRVVDLAARRGPGAAPPRCSAPQRGAKCDACAVTTST